MTGRRENGMIIVKYCEKEAENMHVSNQTGRTPAWGTAVLGLVLYDKLGVSAGGTVLACGAASLVMPYLFFRLAGRLRLRPLLRRLGLPG